MQLDSERGATQTSSRGSATSFWCGIRARCLPTSRARRHNTGAHGHRCGSWWTPPPPVRSFPSSTDFLPPVVPWRPRAGVELPAHSTTSICDDDGGAWGARSVTASGTSATSIVKRAHEAFWWGRGRSAGSSCRSSPSSLGGDGLHCPVSHVSSASGNGTTPSPGLATQKPPMKRRGCFFCKSAAQKTHPIAGFAKPVGTGPVRPVPGGTGLARYTNRSGSHSKTVPINSPAR
jgi:hypothetical protein